MLSVYKGLTGVKGECRLTPEAHLTSEKKIRESSIERSIRTEYGLLQLKRVWQVAEVLDNMAGCWPAPLGSIPVFARIDTPSRLAALSAGYL